MSSPAYGDRCRFAAACAPSGPRRPSSASAAEARGAYGTAGYLLILAGGPTQGLECAERPTEKGGREGKNFSSQCKGVEARISNKHEPITHGRLAGYDQQNWREKNYSFRWRN
eukprot:GHVT01049681.1.p2 GENE.GHVT01049681.1~~GHVT01049681.1.p2  ORF type:complete len:113 (-),score=23.12 GHVT01049681.1:901-1239(-)